MTLDEMIDAIMGAKVIAFFIQAAAPEDGNDYRLYSPVAEDDHLLIPVDDAGIREPVYHGAPFMPEEPIPALTIQGIPPQEEDVDAEMHRLIIRLTQRKTKKILQ